MALERPLEALSDDEVLAGLDGLLRQSRRVEAPLVAHIGEVHARHLYARFAAPSMFSYCTTVLHLSEGEAQLRITVARTAREHPVLLEMLADGRLHLSGIARLAPVLTRENRERLLARATHKSKRQIEEMVAELAPRPDAASMVRKLPERPLPAATERAAAGERAGPVPAPTGIEVAAPPLDTPRPVAIADLRPLSASRYRIQFTAGRELHDDLERLQALMRSELPNGDLGAIVARAVRELRERLEARRFAQTKSPRANRGRTSSLSRRIPADVRRFVYRRDGGQCRFFDERGCRCPERHRLEFHHRHPFALGGGKDSDNICLMCPTHNRFLAEQDYGRTVMARYRRSGVLPSDPFRARSPEPSTQPSIAAAGTSPSRAATP